MAQKKDAPAKTRGAAPKAAQPRSPKRALPLQGGFERVSWHIPDLDCPSKGQKITAVLSNYNLTQPVEFDFAAQRLSLILPLGTDLAALEEGLRGQGFPPENRVQTSLVAELRPKPATATAARHAKAAPISHAPGAKVKQRAVSASDAWQSAAKPLGKGFLNLQQTVANLPVTWIFVLCATLLCCGFLLGRAGFSVPDAALGRDMAQARFWGLNLEQSLYLFISVLAVLTFASRSFRAISVRQFFGFETLCCLCLLAGLGVTLFAPTAVMAVLALFVLWLGDICRALGRGASLGSGAAQWGEVMREGPRGALVNVAWHKLRKGDLIKLGPGEVVPAKGEIVSGWAAFDQGNKAADLCQSDMSKQLGDSLGVGERLTAGLLRMRVTEVPSRAALAALARTGGAVQRLGRRLPPAAQRLGRATMLMALLLALGVAIIPPLVALYAGAGQGGAQWGEWALRGAVVLLLSVPCAAFAALYACAAMGLARGAQLGLLPREAELFDTLAKVAHVAFDKSGALTQAKPKVSDIRPAHANVTPAMLLAWAASAEENLTHPLALALRHAAEAKNVVWKTAHNQNLIAGKGVEAKIGRIAVQVLSPIYARKLGLLPAHDLAQVDALELSGKTVLVVAARGGFQGLIALEDRLREDAFDALEALRQMGATPIMLTADSEKVAQAVARPLGLDFRAAMLPADKLRAVRSLQVDGSVMVVGDVRQEGPALHMADVSVALASGQDLSQAAVDVVILGDTLDAVAQVIALARLVRRCGIAGIWLALLGKALAFAMLFAGGISLWQMIGLEAVLVVVSLLLALRIKAFRRDAG